MTIDLGTMLAFVLAAASLAVTSIVDGNAEITVRQGVFLLLPLAAIAWPEMLEAGYGPNSRRGFSRDREGPTPAIIIRVVGWILLVVVVVAHHYSGTPFWLDR